MNRRVTLAAISLLPIVACSSPRPGDPLERIGDEIVICGELYHTGTPVVLWTDPGGYDAYRVEPRFPELMTEAEQDDFQTKAHYHSIRRHVPDGVKERVAKQGWSADELADHVDQFVVHYDVCGTAKKCFQVLHDQRYLSVHFLLDTDGTLYQTLDVKERAWHAAKANDRSIGVEIAQIGAYPQPDHERLVRWYDHDEHGPYITYDGQPETGVRTPGFVARPARPEIQDGPIHDDPLYQYDFTEEQYQALARLLATLNRVLPRIELDAPRDAEGRVLDRALDETEYDAFSGVLGHFHVTTRKIDPGPAFDWDRVLSVARELAD